MRPAGAQVSANRPATSCSARARLGHALEALAGHGVQARGQIGDADPMLAIQDACRAFTSDAVIISTHPASHSHWLERGLLERAHAELSVPIVHLESRYGLAAA